MEPRSPTLQADFLLSEPPGKPKKPMNTGVDSLSLSPGDLPNPGIKPGSPALQTDSLSAEPPGKPLKAIAPVHSPAASQYGHQPAALF